MIYFCCFPVDGSSNAKEKGGRCAIAPDSSSAQCIRKTEREEREREEKRGEKRSEEIAMEKGESLLFFLQEEKEKRWNKGRGRAWRDRAPRNRCNYL